MKINAFQPNLITIPDVKNTSHRQALAMLQSLGFEEISEKKVKGQYMDLVMGLESNGKSLKPGQRIPANTPLELLVSSGSEEMLPFENPISPFDEISPDENPFNPDDEVQDLFLH